MVWSTPHWLFGQSQKPNRSVLRHSEEYRCDTCLSRQGSFLRTGPRQQQVPHHHLIAHLVELILMIHVMCRSRSASGKGPGQQARAGPVCCCLLFCCARSHWLRSGTVDFPGHSVVGERHRWRELVKEKVVYLDDCSVQIILSPGVWLLSCSRFQFKNYLRRQACLTTVNNVHGGQSCLTLSSHLSSTNILYFMFWKLNTTPWQLCYSWSSLQPKKVTDPTCPWLWGQSQDSLRKYFISMITGVNKNNTREPPPTLERHESGI